MFLLQNFEGMKENEKSKKHQVDIRDDSDNNLKAHNHFLAYAHSKIAKEVDDSND